MSPTDAYICSNIIYDKIDQKHLKCPSREEWIKVLYIDIIKGDSATNVKENKLKINATHLNIKNTMSIKEDQL